MVARCDRDRVAVRMRNTVRRHLQAILSCSARTQVRSKCPVALPVSPQVASGQFDQAGPAKDNQGATMNTQPTPKGAWKITFLLFLFMLVNFADKIVVGLAGVPIMTELKL